MSMLALALVALPALGAGVSPQGVQVGIGSQHGLADTWDGLTASARADLGLLGVEVDFLAGLGASRTSSLDETLV